MADHITEKWSFELGLSNQGASYGIQSQVFELMEGPLQDVLASVLDHFEEQFGAHTLSRLYLDLGDLEEGNWQEQFKERLPQILLKALLDHAQQLPVEERKTTTQGHEENGLRLFAYYLQHGNLPWWAGGKKIDLIELFKELLSSETAALVHHIRTLGKQLAVAQRMALLVTEETFSRTIAALEPGHASFIIDYVDTVLAVHANEPFSQRPQNQLAHRVRQLVVIDLLTEHGSSFNRKMFIQRQIHALANAFGKSFMEMLDALSAELELMDLPFSLRTALPALLLRIREETQQKETSPNEAQTPTDVQLFEAYIKQSGTQPYGISQFKTALAAEPEAVVEVLKSIPPENYIRSRLLTVFGVEIGLPLVWVIAPEQSDFISTYTEQLFYLHAKKPVVKHSQERYEVLVWELVLVDLIKTYHSTFERRSFVQRTLNAMAQREGMAIADLLLGFLDALGRVELPARFHQSIGAIISTLGQRALKTAAESAVEQPVKKRITRLNELIVVETGRDRKALSTLWEILALEERSALRTWLADVAKTEAGIKVLVQVLSEEQLVDIVELVEPSHAETIVSYKRRLQHIASEDTSFKSERKAFEQAQWEIIIHYLLNKRGTRFNTKSFLKAILAGVARRFGRTYGQLLMVLSQSLQLEVARQLPSGLTVMLKELSAEQEEQDLRLSPGAEASSQGPTEQDVNEWALSYLDTGVIPWDALLTHADLDFNLVFRQWLQRQLTRPKGLFLSPKAWTDRALIRLIEWTGIEQAPRLVAMAFRSTSGNELSSHFLQAIKDFAPDQERHQRQYFAQLMAQVLHGETIDFEVLAKQAHKEVTPPANDRLPVESAQYWASIFMMYLSGVSQAKQVASLEQVLPELFKTPELLKELFQQLDQRREKRLLDEVDEAILDQLLSTLCSFYPEVKEMMQALERLAEADASLMASILLKKHWKAAFLAWRSTELKGATVADWMPKWWKALVASLHLSEEKASKFKAAYVAVLKGTLKTAFLKSLKMNKAKVGKSGGVTPLPTLLLQFISETGGQQGVQRSAQLESQWRAFMYFNPLASREALAHLQPTEAHIQHWTTHLSASTLERMLVLLEPNKARRLVQVLTDLWQVLYTTGTVKESGVGPSRWLWATLFRFWQQGGFDYFEEKIFSDFVFLEWSQWVPHNATQLKETAVGSLKEHGLSTARKEQLQMLLLDSNLSRSTSPAAGGSKLSALNKTSEKQKEQQPFEEALSSEMDTQSIYVTNAGLVLLWPYFNRLFQRLGLAEASKFPSEAEHQKAILITQYLVSGSLEYVEYELPLNKLLCGWPMAKPITVPLELTDEEQELCKGLLQASIQNWAAIGNTSVEGFRDSFLRREGKLARGEERWELTVQSKAFDMLLDNIPWTYKTVKLPWMEDLLDVDWR